MLSARDLADAGGLPIASLASQCWNLDDVAEQYRAFSKNFGPLENCWTRRPRQPRPSSSASCCCTLAPDRPARSPPARPDAARQLAGRAARELCGRLYWRVFDASEAHLDALAARDNERYTPLTADVAARFGGRPA